VTPEDTDAREAPEAAVPPGRVALFVATALVALILDVISKIVVVDQLKVTDRPVRVLGGLFYLQQTRNAGAAFSLGTGFTIVLTGVAVAVVVIIARAASRLRSAAWALALGLILGGALGNLSDRIFRSPGIGRGQVVDWISAFGPNAEHWPIFNLADSAIVCGAILAGLLAVLGIDFDGRQPRHRRRE
jgi:signal peptidase II